AVLHTMRHGVWRLLQWQPRLRVRIHCPRVRLPRLPSISKLNIFGWLAHCSACLNWLLGWMQLLTQRVLCVRHNLDASWRRATDRLAHLWHCMVVRKAPADVAVAIQALRRGRVRALFELLRDVAHMDR